MSITCDAKLRTVKMCHFEGDDSFIFEVHGLFTIEDLSAITQNANDNPDETFAFGDGMYLFSAEWFPGQYGDEGRCELMPGFELTLIQFTPHDIIPKQHDDNPSEDRP